MTTTTYGTVPSRRIRLDRRALAGFLVGACLATGVAVGVDVARDDEATSQRTVGLVGPSGPSPDVLCTVTSGPC